MAESCGDYSAYQKVRIETASQGKLIVMLFNGAIQRAEEGRRQIERRQFEKAHHNLIRAQEIIAELRGALDMSTGKLASDLDRIYEYFQHLLIQANIRKDPKPGMECVELMTQMRDTWQEAFEKVDREKAPAAPPAPYNPHGASVINVKG